MILQSDTVSACYTIKKICRRYPRLAADGLFVITEDTYRNPKWCVIQYKPQALFRGDCNWSSSPLHMLLCS